MTKIMTSEPLTWTCPHLEMNIHFVFISTQKLANHNRGNLYIYINLKDTVAKTTCLIFVLPKPYNFCLSMEHK